MALKKSMIKKLEKHASYNELYLIILDSIIEKPIPEKYKNKVIKSKKFSDFLLLNKKETEDFARHYEFEEYDNYIYAFPDVIPHTMNNIGVLINDYEHDFLKVNINKEGEVDGDVYYMIDVTKQFLD